MKVSAERADIIDELSNTLPARRNEYGTRSLEKTYWRRLCLVYAHWRAIVGIGNRSANPLAKRVLSWESKALWHVGAAAPAPIAAASFPIAASIRFWPSSLAAACGVATPFPRARSSPCIASVRLHCCRSASFVFPFLTDWSARVRPHAW